MAAVFTVIFVLHILVASAQQLASEQVLDQKRPHLTGCFSANMETFRCRWNVGTFQNLTEPGDLRLFYRNKKPNFTPPKDWDECPHYSGERHNECIFNENYTTVWTCYSVQLRSRNQDVVYEEDSFYIEDIVKPDPPVGLNWTLLNVGLTGTVFDILLNWEPPQSADVKMGWMTLLYEVQYREVNATLWKAVGLEKSQERTIYGLPTNVEHEVRVRCKMLASKSFGEFSESIIIPSRASKFPVIILLVFAVLCLISILTLVVSQQQKLMVILLPPIPAPKIKGIDPEMLKKGKLSELMSVLGAHPDLRPELYNSDSWVEFIDLDIEEPSNRLTDLDTDSLIDRSPSSNCSPLSIGFRDDDSGRASCCDPDLPCDPEPSHFQPLHQASRSATHVPSNPGFPVPTTPPGESPRVVPGRRDLYAQVTEMRASGEVLLAPEDRAEAEKTAGGDVDPGQVKGEAQGSLHLLVVNADSGGYASELDAGKMSPRSCAGESCEPCQRDESSPKVYQHVGDYQRPPEAAAFAPVYTMVEGVDRLNSLMLTSDPTSAMQPVVAKALPAPGAYLTPDLLGDITA